LAVCVVYGLSCCCFRANAHHMTCVVTRACTVAAEALRAKVAVLERRLESKQREVSDAAAIESDQEAAAAAAAAPAATGTGERPAWWVDKKEAEQRAASPQVSYR
jgi:hypothetical protein